jgi:hypothetical protein
MPDNDGWKDELLDVLRNLLSEENTDRLIAHILDAIGPRLPWWVPGGLVEKILDAILPGVLLDALAKLVDDVA